MSTKPSEAGVAPMRDLLERQTADTRFTAFLMGVFGGLALALATIGIYGVISYSVAQRSHESRSAHRSRSSTLGRLWDGDPSGNDADGCRRRTRSDQCCCPHPPSGESTLRGQPDRTDGLWGNVGGSSACRTHRQLPSGPPGHKGRSSRLLAVRVSSPESETLEAFALPTFDFGPPHKSITLKP